MLCYAKIIRNLAYLTKPHVWDSSKTIEITIERNNHQKDRIVFACSKFELEVGNIRIL